MKEHIYIADDEKDVCSLLKKHLESEGYFVRAFYDGIELLDAFEEQPCDLIITDIMMKVMSGYELCRKLRAISDVPIIMISAKNDEIDKIIGLELGSDDYISKPFSLREISVKAKNMLKRRKNMKLSGQSDLLICRNLKILIEDRSIRINDEALKVTVKEYDLLTLLIENVDKAFSREEIIQKIWGYDYVGDARQVDHLIKRLRKKMLLANSECKIETVWGYGYKVSGNV